MVKLASIIFTGLLTCLFLLGVLASYFPMKPVFPTLINTLALVLLAVGIWLIIALIIDRYRESRREGDDYKKF
jgi:ABC-type transport system involved in cytochrome c biogenesis permease subunit